ncbi:hypothetical protein HD595_001944 [Nonomuraea roseoviolacea subsp. carminata]|uniref:Uncharacterized protein n=1 Tax=Nonomuraea roseoviolacea subsp. carminata TaxID=160689 RepID=A0ABT1JWN7_9ACTN|nr:hypothetical protein [Nonomuraea roseoviolacea subsp. carminata]
MSGPGSPGVSVLERLGERGTHVLERRGEGRA